jgi:hypothetical protein
LAVGNSWRWGRYKYRVKEAESSGNSLYSCMKMKKMRHVETFPGMREDNGDYKSN